jgi:uncharacterized protein YrrD
MGNHREIFWFTCRCEVNIRIVAWELSLTIFSELTGSKQFDVDPLILSRKKNNHFENKILNLLSRSL